MPPTQSASRVVGDVPHDRLGDGVPKRRDGQGQCGAPVVNAESLGVIEHAKAHAVQDQRVDAVSSGVSEYLAKGDNSTNRGVGAHWNCILRKSDPGLPSELATGALPLLHVHTSWSASVSTLITKSRGTLLQLTARRDAIKRLMIAMFPQNRCGSGVKGFTCRSRLAGAYVVPRALSCRVRAVVTRVPVHALPDIEV